MPELKITSCSVHIIENNDSRNRMKASATIVLNDVFAVHDLKVIDGPRGMFVAMPNKPRRGQESNFHSYVDIAHPLNPNFRKYLEEVVLSQFYAAMRRQEKSS